MSAVEVVTRQVEAYNSHALDAFLTCYARDAQVRQPDGTVTLDGIDAIAAQYSEWFRQFPELRVEVRGRLAVGDWVVDEEDVVLDGAKSISGLAAYRVVEGLISAVVLMADAG